jgi:serine/threonine protein kinase
VGAAVDHKNLVRTLLFCKSDQRAAYLVMDFVEGVTLGDLIALHSKLSWREACNYVFQASIGLQKLHDAGIVHRAVEPGNLLVERSGALKVADFGEASAAFLDDAVSDRRECASLANRATDYSAPEIFDENVPIGPPADIYSLGCTFYHALAGTVPFPDVNGAAKMHAHRTLPPQPIRSHVSHVPAEVIGVVRKMMAKSPERRFASMLEVSRALSALARPQPAYFDRYVILSQRSVAARSQLRERARQIADRLKSIEPSAATST